MRDPSEMNEAEPLDLLGEAYEDEYFDGEDLDLAIDSVLDLPIRYIEEDDWELF